MIQERYHGIAAYFWLQYIMTNRKLRDTGLHPFIGYLGILIGFAWVVGSLFQKTEFAPYLLVLGALASLTQLSDNSRTAFLHSTFGDEQARKIRIVEHALLGLPFLVALLVEHAFAAAGALLLLTILMALYFKKTDLSLPIPTPFSRHPFEFTVGFRKTFYLIGFAYVLAIIGIAVDNANLTVFSMLLIFLVSASYYYQPENEYFVWIYAATPAAFLLGKLKWAAIHVWLLALPVLIGFAVFYLQKIDLLLLFFGMGLLFLWALILAKYAAYPREINVPEAMFLGFSIYFPPLLLALVPFFYRRAIQKLNVFLHDSY